MRKRRLNRFLNLIQLCLRLLKNYRRKSLFSPKTMSRYIWICGLPSTRSPIYFVYATLIPPCADIWRYNVSSLCLLWKSWMLLISLILWELYRLECWRQFICSRSSWCHVCSSLKMRICVSCLYGLYSCVVASMILCLPMSLRLGLDSLRRECNNSRGLWMIKSWRSWHNCLQMASSYWHSIKVTKGNSLMKWRVRLWTWLEGPS